MMKQSRNRLDRVDVARIGSRPRAQAPVRYRWLVLAVALVVWQPGCSVYHLAKRTMYCELNEYPQVTDGKLACRQYQHWAKQEWQRVRSESGEPFSHDYVSGFLQGFVDQVYAGGKPHAPPVPPRKYWRVGYRNARGREAIEDWYHGFEHGAQVAHDGGYRARAVVPSSLVPGSGQDLRLREGFDDEPELVPENEGPGELQPPSEITKSESKAHQPPSVLPVSFEQAEPIPVVEETWGDEPPAPPWHSAAKPQAADVKPAGAEEFDPFQGAITSEPSAKASNTKASDTKASNTKASESAKSAELPSDFPSATSLDAPGLELNAPRNTDTAADETPSAFSEPDKTDAADADAGPEATGSGATKDGWQNKIEPTPWKSRDHEDEP